MDQRLCSGGGCGWDIKGGIRSDDALRCEQLVRVELSLSFTLLALVPVTWIGSSGLRHGIDTWARSADHAPGVSNLLVSHSCSS